MTSYTYKKIDDFIDLPQDIRKKLKSGKLEPYKMDGFFNSWDNSKSHTIPDFKWIPSYDYVPPHESPKFEYAAVKTSNAPNGTLYYSRTKIAPKIVPKIAPKIAPVSGGKRFKKSRKAKKTRKARKTRRN